MGLLMNWWRQATAPVRNLRLTFHRFKTDVLAMLYRPTDVGRGVVNDVKQLGRSAGVGRKPNRPP
jgi:hypothetical protein